MSICSACKLIKFVGYERERFNNKILCDKCYEDFCDREDTFPSMKMEVDENGKIKKFEINRVNQLKE